jgi:exonuclease III
LEECQEERQIRKKNENYDTDDSSSSEVIKVPSSVDEEKQNGRLFRLPLGKRSRRQPVNRSNDFFMIMPQNMKNLKSLHRSCNLTQVVNFKHKHTMHNTLHLFHQNIRGIQHKLDELICMLHSYDLSPHIICITEHYLTEYRLSLFKPDNYCLTSQYLCQLNKGGGVCIYCKPDLDINPVDITQFCLEKVIDTCAAQLKIGNKYIIILCIYRSPSGNVEQFIMQFEKILKYIYKPKFEIIACGDFNVNFLENSSKLHQIIFLFQSYNLFQVVDFPTRITKDSSTAIDSIFLNYSRLNIFQVFSIINGLSDHDAQYLILNSFFSTQRKRNQLVKRRILSESNIANFTLMLHRESWDSILSSTDVNVSFNSFLNTF